MPTNINDFYRRASWVPPQNQPYAASRFVAAHNGRPQYALPQNLAQAQRPMAQKPKGPQKMPKERAMDLANRFKRGFAIASIVGFGTLSGLVALHQIGTTTTVQPTQSSSGSSSTNSSSSSNSSNSTNSSSQSGGSFFNQQGGNTGGSSSSSSSNSSTSSGTHTS